MCQRINSSYLPSACHISQPRVFNEKRWRAASVEEPWASPPEDPSAGPRVLHARGLGQALPPKLQGGSADEEGGNALRCKEDKAILIKKTAAREDLLLEMAEDDLGKQASKPFRVADEEVSRIDSPRHFRDLEATFVEALVHYFELTFWSRTLKDNLTLTTPGRTSFTASGRRTRSLRNPFHDIQKGKTSYQATHNPPLWRVMLLDDCAIPRAGLLRLSEHGYYHFIIFQLEQASAMHFTTYIECCKNVPSCSHRSSPRRLAST